MRTLLALILLSAMANSLSAQSDPNFPVRVRIAPGWIEGSYHSTTGIQSYLGIPFAQAPVGLLRWRAPQAPIPWQDVRLTKQFGPRPVQASVFGDMYSRSAGMSEDCLYLNVWTPAKRDTRDLPVLVYFYGGGFIAGDASEPRYDGAAMAREGIVVVSANYRLNIFGFLAHPELSRESSYKGSGNYGLLDQHAALLWVKENIAAFGGNPDRITIAGESAGSVSVSAHMTSPLSVPLIAGAIGESGAGIFPTLSPVPLAEAEKKGLEIVSAAGFPTLNALRELSTRDLFELFIEPRKFSFPTVIDGYFFPRSPLDILRSGDQARVPLLVGWNSAEIPGQSLTQGKVPDAATFQNRVKELYPTDFSKILSLYPGSQDMEALQSATDLASDRFIVYSTWKWASLHARSGSTMVFRYLFSRIPGSSMDSETGSPKRLGAPHACEIEYAMGNLSLVRQTNWTNDDFSVSKTMFSFFSRFIRTGNPNGPDLPSWDTYAPIRGKEGIMRLDVVSGMEDLPTEERYRLLDKLYGNDR